MLGRISDPPGSAPGHDHLLAIDLGASNTVALIRRADGQIRPLLFGGEPMLPSGVLLDRDGTVRVGRDAEQRAALDPTRFEPAPRQRLAESSVRLGERECPVAELLAGLLTAVAEAAVGTVGALPSVALTYPVAWGATEQGRLRSAAELAGFPAITLVPEPVAAASTRPVAVGEHTVVVDVGARGFDVAVLRRGPADFAVLAIGGDRMGGRRVDAAIAAHLAAAAGRHQREVWRAIDRPRDADQRRAQRAFWDEVRDAKAMLGSAESAPVLVPGLAAPALLTCDDLDRLARPLVDRVVGVTGRVLRDAHLKASDVDQLLLIGGSARLAALTAAIRRAFPVEPAPIDRPEWVVASGALVRLAASPVCASPVCAVPVGGGHSFAPGSDLEPVSRSRSSSLSLAAPARWARALARPGRSGRRPVGALPAPPRRLALPSPRAADTHLPVPRRPSGVAVPTGSDLGPAPSGWRTHQGVIALGAAIVLLLILAGLFLTFGA